MKTNKGFTLVEILIVVVILGILAAIVIPQFTGASTSAKLSTMQNEVQTLASQRELFSLQHNEITIDLAPIGDIETALTTATDVLGDTWTAGEDQYGPYFQTIPKNPFNGLNTIVEQANYNTAAAGWIYNTTTHQFAPAFIDMDRDNVSDGTEANYAK